MKQETSGDRRTRPASANQPARSAVDQIEREARERPYWAGACELGVGHRLERSVDAFGSGPERCTYFVLRAVTDGGECVGFSYSPEPDQDAEREMTLDFLLGERR